ncbi:Gfo/Idh/MocA family oxidoreductase [Ruminococcus sp. OA3]|uniref:Gfo/Idh/MocA family protein n=1 Tax=Ruminococcus sp. OA3 TaxID=2914164 RepID=UPI001F06B4DC|nr:Gfo/Idh/MocA family oxidoreductase [Ruminococcus sp. OA3]MCH1981452.1 Gfo/Idh/MocA family oxidoreductase [Ruminococcus sp. OA3]
MEKKLRFGMVGGGNGGNIGNSHRRGAAMDNLAVLSAGCFTRNAKCNQEDGVFWGVEPERIYGSYQEMAEKEAARTDGIDFVSVVTPNATHYEITKCFLEHGINVVCEKPFTLEVSQAEELQALAVKKGLEVCVTYTYAHYPIMRECRKLIETGVIGRVIDVVAEYPQDWMILGLNSEEDNFTAWIGDPKKSGNSNVTAAMGVHLYYLIHAMTGLKIKQVLSDFGYYPQDAPLETTARILMDFNNGVHGLCWTSNVAIGHDCTIELKIYGEKGAIQWSHEDPTHLRVSMLGGPVQIYAANREYLCEESREMSRIPAGHPEGFYEAFANIYHEFCRHLLDKKNQCAASRASYFYPHAEDGVEGVRFVQACVKSQKEGNIWISM